MSNLSIHSKEAPQKRPILSRLLALPLVLFAFFAPLISSSSVSAAVSIDVGKAAAPKDFLEGRIYAEGVSCIYEKYTKNDGRDVLRRDITTNEATKMDIFTATSGDGDSNAITGSDIMSLVSSAKDGEIECEELEPALKTVIPKIYEDPMSFILKFYEKKDDGGYKLRDKDTVLAAARTILDSNFVTSLNENEAKLARDAIAFAQCFKEGPSGMDPKNSDTPSLSKGFVYLDGKDSNSTVKYGYSSFGPNHTYQCFGVLSSAEKMGDLGDIAAYLKEYDVTTDILRKNPQDLYANLVSVKETDERMATARGDITTLLESSPEKVKYCLGYSGLPTDGIPIASVVEFLVTGSTSQLAYTLPDTTATEATDEEAETLKACLLGEGAFGQELKGLLDGLSEDLSKINENLVKNRGSQGDQSDDCLSSDDFLGWFVCPVLNLVDSVLETLEDVIQSMLRFSLEDTTVDTVDSQGQATTVQIYGQNQNDELHTSWNIFRSIATILLTIGFLVALLVKAIKG